MKTIYKYPLPDVTKDFGREFYMPAGAEVIHVDAQTKLTEVRAAIKGDPAVVRIPTIWAIVDTEAPLERRRFQVYGTGHPIDSEVKGHVGSVIIDALVWHIFERA